MRQVPGQPVYAIIGKGRVARHFCHYLSLLNIPHKQWSRSDSSLLSDVVAACSPVLLLINDSAIEPFIRDNACLADRCCVHFSGNLVTDLAHGAHPLMTFGPELYTLEAYQEIPWVVENTAPPFSELLPSLSNPSFPTSRHSNIMYPPLHPKKFLHYFDNCTYIYPSLNL